MRRLKLKASEVDQIETLLSVVMQEYKHENCECFLRNVHHLAHKMPTRVCEFLADFKYDETSLGACVISGLPIDEECIGDTPITVETEKGRNKTQKEHFLSCLLSSLLGDVFGWATQQNGKLVHDIAPIKAHEYEQIGSGSKELITLHNEDAFHDYRADYLALLCLRNPDNVSTICAKLNLDDLTPTQRRLLHEPKFIIRPDNSHLEFNNANSGDNEELANLKKQSFDKIKKELDEGIPISLLFGDYNDPYLRLDAYFMDEPVEPDYKEAFDALCLSLSNNTIEIPLNPGDILFVDNYRVLHGRNPFQARFDGKDRWLKRLNITRGLRRSRDSRLSSTSRVIY